MCRKILVVSPDDNGLSDVLSVLTSAGYEACGAATFEDASRLLANESPDLLIADERLGPFNGLHLVIRGRAAHPHMSAIVTTQSKDSVVESDARRFNAECVVKPADPRDLLVPVSHALEQSVFVHAH
jgi:DNA-binding NtrC family response regulator